MPFAGNGTVELYYETFGRARDESLLLVNGLASQCINFDVELCQKFADNGFFVIRFDNRDVGLSSKLDDFTPHLKDVTSAVREGRDAHVPYQLSDMANDAVAVLDDLVALFPALMIQQVLVTGEMPNTEFASRVIHDVILPLATAPTSAIDS